MGHVPVLRSCKRFLILSVLPWRSSLSPSLPLADKISRTNEVILNNEVEVKLELNLSPP